MISHIILIVTSVFFSSASQILLKLGAGSATFSPNLSGILSIMLNKYIILGISFQVVALLIWLFVLKRVEVSFAYPFVGLGFILVMVYGYFFLHEGVDIYRMGGVFLIVLGLISISLSYAK